MNNRESTSRIKLTRYALITGYMARCTFTDGEVEVDRILFIGEHGRVRSEAELRLHLLQPIPGQIVENTPVFFNELPAQAKLSAELGSEALRTHIEFQNDPFLNPQNCTQEEIAAANARVLKRIREINDEHRG